MFLILNGHSGRQNRLSMPGEHGNLVHMLGSDFVGIERNGERGGGWGYLRIMRFDPVSDTLEVTSYTPYLDAYLTDEQNQFTLKQMNLFVEN